MSSRPPPEHLASAHHLTVTLSTWRQLTTSRSPGAPSVSSPPHPRHLPSAHDLTRGSYRDLLLRRFKRSGCQPRFTRAGSPEEIIQEQSTREKNMTRGGGGDEEERAQNFRRVSYPGTPKVFPPPGGPKTGGGGGNNQGVKTKDQRTW